MLSNERFSWTIMITCWIFFVALPAMATPFGESPMAARRAGGMPAMPGVVGPTALRPPHAAIAAQAINAPATTVTRWLFLWLVTKKTSLEGEEPARRGSGEFRLGLPEHPQSACPPSRFVRSAQPAQASGDGSRTAGVHREIREQAHCRITPRDVGACHDGRLRAPDAPRSVRRAEPPPRVSLGAPSHIR